MFQAIKNFAVMGTNKAISSEDIMSSAQATFTAIGKDIIPSLKLVLKSNEYFKSDKIYLIKNLGQALELRSDHPKDVIKTLLSFFKDVSSEESNFTKLIETQVSSKLFYKLATAQELAIMKTVSDISSITLFSLDLLYYTILDDDTDYPKYKVEYLKEGTNNFRSLISPYLHDFSKVVDDLYKVAKTDIKENASVSLMDKLLAKNGRLINLPILNGFINNPIYHIRVWMVDREIAKYEALKEKKKLLELKLLDLKMRAAGKHDDRLQKQIKYYEDKISGIEYDIKETES